MKHGVWVLGCLGIAACAGAPTDATDETDVVETDETDVVETDTTVETDEPADTDEAADTDGTDTDEAADTDLADTDDTDPVDTDTDTDAADTDAADTDAADTDAADTDAADTDTDLFAGLATSWSGTFSSSALPFGGTPGFCTSNSTLTFTVDPAASPVIDVVSFNCVGGLGEPVFSGNLFQPQNGLLPLAGGSFVVSGGFGPFTGTFLDADRDGTYDSFSGAGTATVGTPMMPGSTSYSLTVSATPTPIAVP